MELEAEVSVRLGSFSLEAGLSVGRGETVALLGPNGAGKSTLLGVLAGLLVPDRGRVVVGGRVLTEVGPTGRRVFVPPHRRKVGLLSQDPLLFPHLTALQNVRFGNPASAANVAAGWLDAVGLAGFERSKPGELSGGQQQRVALARALAAQPDVVLLDEPMAGLDPATASLTRSLLGQHLAARGTTTVLVSHDPVDVLALADRFAVLDSGRIGELRPVDPAQFPAATLDP